MRRRFMKSEEYKVQNRKQLIGYPSQLVWQCTIKVQSDGSLWRHTYCTQSIQGLTSTYVHRYHGWPSSNSKIDTYVLG